MASKKIGAYIALEGEKRFRQDVTNCNKTLTTLKSEMSLVSAESAGQENTLESLRKKHEVLSKTLEAHKQKETALQAGLDHAKESYEKAGKQLGEYKEKLQSAREELENMKQDSDTTDESLEEQKKTVAELSDMVKKGEQTYAKAGNRIDEWQTKLNTARAQTIKATGALNENTAYMREAENAADHCAKSIDAFGKKEKEVSEVTLDFASILGVNLCDRALDLVADSTKKVAQFASETETSMKKLQASTGLTAAETEKYKESLDSLYKNNYGDSLEDIANSMALVKQYTNETDPTVIEELTENAIALDDAFENMDLSETIRGVDALMTNMGLTAQEAFDYIAAGAQKGLNKSGELTDNIAEYSQLWSQAGFSAEEMFTILDNGLSSGAYNLDKVNDFVKEFSISLSDGRIEENLDSFSEGTQTLFKQWQNGEVATKDVFYSIIGDLSSMTSQQEALTIASNVWSALGEDNAMKVITSLDDVNDTYKDVHGTMEDIKSVRYDTLESRIEQLGRKVMYDFVRPVGEKALPALEKSLDVIIENTDTLIPLTETAVAGLVTYKTASAAITAYQKATEDATLAQALLNTVMNANPTALIVAGMTAVAVAAVAFSRDVGTAAGECEELRESARAMSEEMQESREEMQKSQEETRQMIEGATASVEAMKPAVKELAALAEQSSYTNDEYDRMENLVTQLNTIYPEMGIEIDSVTGKLNMGSEEILTYVGNLERMAEADAYQQGMEESVQRATDAIKEKTVAEKELNTLYEKKHDLTRMINTLDAEQRRQSQLAAKSEERLNEMLEEGMITQEEYRRAVTGATDAVVEYNGEQRNASELISELTSEQEKNEEAIESLAEQIDGHNETIKEAQEESDLYAEKYKELTEQVEAATAAEQANAEAVSESSTANITAAGQQLAAFNSLSENQQQLAVDLTNSFVTMEENLQNSISAQLGLFDELNTGAETSLDAILKGLDSQIQGVETWEQNLATLIDWGINNDLLQTLIDAGPQTGSAVQAIIDAGEGEIATLNEKWALKESVLNATNEAGEVLKTSGAESIARGFDGVDELMKASGADTVRGLVEGMKEAQKEAEDAGEELGVKTIESTKEGLGTHSPSVKTKEAGKDTVQGLVDGINNKLSLARTTGKKLGTTAIDALKNANMYDNAFSVGENFGSGLAAGIQSKTDQIAAQAAATVRTAINAANAEQNANSPAKETIKVGHNFGEGIEVGIHDMITEVSEASEGIMDAALSIAERKAMIAESVDLPRNNVRMNSVSGLRNEITQGMDYKELANVFGDATEDIVIEVLKKVQLNLAIDGRQADRFLKNRGVLYG